MKRRAFYAQHLDSERLVLFEQHKNPALLSGFTDNYVKIEVPFEAGKINTLAPIQLGQLSADGDAVMGFYPEYVG